MDERVSWVPAGIRGIQPNNCYILLASDACLVIDSGAHVHGRHVVDSILRLVPRDTPVDFIFTRMESDCIGNLGEIASRYAVQHAYAPGASNPFDFFDDIGSNDVVPQLSNLRIVRKPPEEPLEWSENALPLTLVRTPLRLLATTWIWDPNTGTLFTSDAFDHVFQPDPTMPEPESDYSLVKAFLTTKFDWLVGADTRRVREELANIFRQHDVQTLAPSRGLPIRGQDQVAAVVGHVLSALEEVGSR